MGNAFALCALCWYCVSGPGIEVEVLSCPGWRESRLSPPSVVGPQAAKVNPGCLRTTWGTWPWAWVTIFLKISPGDPAQGAGV